jgi:hypothetical protein
MGGAEAKTSAVSVYGWGAVGSKTDVVGVRV